MPQAARTLTRVSAAPVLYPEKKILTKDGRSALIRNAALEDADELIHFLKTVSHGVLSRTAQNRAFHTAPWHFYYPRSLPPYCTLSHL